MVQALGQQRLAVRVQRVCKCRADCSGERHTRTSVVWLAHRAGKRLAAQGWAAWVLGQSSSPAPAGPALLSRCRWGTCFVPLYSPALKGAAPCWLPVPSLVPLGPRVFAGALTPPANDQWEWGDPVPPPTPGPNPGTLQGAASCCRLGQWLASPSHVSVPLGLTSGLLEQGPFLAPLPGDVLGL